MKDIDLYIGQLQMQLLGAPPAEVGRLLKKLQRLNKRAMRVGSRRPQ